MPQKSRPNRSWYLVLVGVVALIVVGGLISLRPYGRPLNWGIRGAALLGYLFIFFAIVSSAYMRRLVRIFGRPFIKVHHVASITGLVRSNVQFAGAMEAGPLACRIVRWQAPLRSPNAPGIDAHLPGWQER